MAKQHSISKLKYLTPIEVMELEEKIKSKQTQQTKDGSPQEYINAVMFDILLKTGMRSSELLLLRPMDMQPDTQTLCVATVKGGKDREMPIPVELYRRLEGLAPGPRKEKIFTIQHRTLLHHWFNFRLCEKKLHSLRHTYAYDLYRKSKDLLLVKRALGHRSINSTMVYQEQYYQQSDISRLVDAYR